MKALSIITTSFIFLLFMILCANQQLKQKMMLLGEITQEKLLSTQGLFEQGYQLHQVSNDDSKLVAHWPDDVHIDIYIGTWCYDSQREVPKLLKDIEKNKSISYRIIALDEEKKDPQGLALLNHVSATPTVVVFRQNKEISRIIEKPQISWVKDISVTLNVM